MDDEFWALQFYKINFEIFNKTENISLSIWCYWVAQDIFHKFPFHFGKFDIVMLHIFLPAKNENKIIETLIVPSYRSWLNTHCVKILWDSLAQKSFNWKFSSFLHQFLPRFLLIYEAKLLSKAEVESFTTLYQSIWSKN